LTEGRSAYGRVHPYVRRPKAEGHVHRLCLGVRFMQIHVQFRRIAGTARPVAIDDLDLQRPQGLLIKLFEECFCRAHRSATGIEVVEFVPVDRLGQPLCDNGAQAREVGVIFRPNPVLHARVRICKCLRDPLQMAPLAWLQLSVKGDLGNLLCRYGAGLKVSPDR
jgi:hypothetical protein